MKKMMQKLQENRKNNKGFTLVELIIVIAIIAVLAAVLAPQYIKYVEQSRVATDKNAVNEIRHAIEISLTNETVNAAVDGTEDSFVITTTADGVASFTSTPTAIEDEVDDSVDATSYTFKSKAYQSKTITIPITGSNGVYTVGEATIA